MRSDRVDKRIGFIGVGNMGSAIIQGLIESNMTNEKQIYGFDYNSTILKEKALQFGFNIGKDNKNIVEQSDIVFLAIKPQVITEVLSEISDFAKPGQIFISMAAGISIEFIKYFFNFDPKIIRIMPNTPALIGEGMTGMATKSPVSYEETLFIKKLLSSFSIVEEVEENLLDAVTAISGSSPAYVDLFIESLADGGVLLGLPRDKSYIFATQAVIGAAKMILETGKHPGILKDMVCSPAGTTIAAVHQLEKHGFRNAIIEAMIAAEKRSKEMNNLFEK
jgi:pyrroline-5-carboxylate reductase